MLELGGERLNGYSKVGRVEGGKDREEADSQVRRVLFSCWPVL